MKRSRSWLSGYKLCIDFADGKRLWVTRQAEKLLEGFDLEKVAPNATKIMEILQIDCAVFRKHDGYLSLMFMVPRYSGLTKLSSEEKRNV